MTDYITETQAGARGLMQLYRWCPAKNTHKSRYGENCTHLNFLIQEKKRIASQEGRIAEIAEKNHLYSLWVNVVVEMEDEENSVAGNLEPSEIKDGDEMLDDEEGGEEE